MNGDDDDGAKYAEMAAELNAEDAANGVDREPITFGGSEPEAAPEPRQDQHQQYQQPSPPAVNEAEIADYLDKIDKRSNDPVGYFTDREDEFRGWARQQEGHQQVQHVLAAVKGSEEALDKDLGGDYMAAIESHEAKLLKSGGMEALQRERIGVVQWALANGQDPATVYYHRAIQSGHVPGVDISRSHMRKLVDLSLDDPAAFDKAWDQYAARASSIDQRRRAGR